jgi:hypothetical protein
MEQARDIRKITLGAVVAASGLSGLTAINLTFRPNTPMKSSAVNPDFSSLKAKSSDRKLKINVPRLNAQVVLENLTMARGFQVSFGLNGTDSTHIEGRHEKNCALEVSYSSRYQRA